MTIAAIAAAGYASSIRMLWVTEKKEPKAMTTVEETPAMVLGKRDRLRASRRESGSSCAPSVGPLGQPTLPLR